ncbi:formate dehydrogenase accessory sulfurtransferase FdhD [Colwelliaceae bacterium BS250]
MTGHIDNIELVQEYAVAITINDVNYAVMMASPFDLDDFVLGLLLTEQVIKQRYDVHDISISLDEISCTAIINVSVANRIFEATALNTRQHKANSSCGICGVKALEQAMPTLSPVVNTPPLSIKHINHVLAQMPTWQIRSNNTGALHAAFLVNESGDIIACREDLGRHNALDKLIGHILSKQINSTSLSIIITSRCSVELVNKTVIANIASLLCLASPSQLAVNIAKANNLNLIHVRKHDAPIYF